MSHRLRDNISSEYINAANRLNGKRARRKIVAYVESYDDVFFWRTVLSDFETDKLFFEVMLPSRENLTKGKKSVLMNLLSKRVGKDMIACVDADYDYLLQGVTYVSKEVNENPYVFHTYVYAIENFQCFAPSLHDVGVAVTLNDRPIFNYEAYLRLYSEAIYPLFVWNIWFYRNNIYGQFTMSDFNRIIKTGNFNMQDPMPMISRMRHKVDSKVRQLEREHPGSIDEVKRLGKEMRQLGVEPSNTYLFIQGHHLFDCVVVPMLNKVCDRLIREREREINRNAVHNTQRRNEMASYTHSIEEIVPMLRRNTGYRQCPQFKQLQADIKAFLSNDGAKAAE